MQLKSMVRATAVTVGISVLMFMMHVANAQVVATASTAGFGAAFGYAQTIGNVSYTQAGSIGNGSAHASARTHGYYHYRYNPHTHKYGYHHVPGSYANSATITHGNAAAFAQSVGSPFGSQAFIQANSFNGFAAAAAAAGP